jgi:hypothetical protein
MRCDALVTRKVPAEKPPPRTPTMLSAVDSPHLARVRAHWRPRARRRSQVVGRPQVAAAPRGWRRRRQCVVWEPPAVVVVSESGAGDEVIMSARFECCSHTQEVKRERENNLRGPGKRLRSVTPG